jgi:hypothetical protein
MAKTGQFLITISGARPEVLDRCPTERIKFQSLGWALLITSGMATVSMWFALTSAMGFNPVLSFPIAILWGLIILGIDRWLVTSMPIDGKRKFLIAAPRLALAILLGSLISTPIVLRIFESEINNQIAIIKQNNEAQFLDSQQHSAVATRVQQAGSRVSNLQQVIDSNGQRPINPATDPVVQGLTAQLKTARTAEQADYHAWQCQLYGGCGAPKGNGPLAAASQARYESDVNQVNTLTSEIQTREKALQATDVNSERARLQQAQQALPTAQAQLEAAQAEENSLLNNFQVTNSATNGLLIRLKALSQLSAGNSTLQATRILLFLLFLIIEVLPVTVKLLQPLGNYERILAKEIKKELNQATWSLRTGVSPIGATDQADDLGALSPTLADGAFETAPRRRREPNPVIAELNNVWERTRAEPVYDWASRAETDYIAPPDENTVPSRLDDQLRGMSDTRFTGGYENEQGGIERRYDDDDL